MNRSTNAAVKVLPQNTPEIPTLDVRIEHSDDGEIKLDKLVEQLAADLQHVFQQQIYHVMAKTLHQVVKQESDKLTKKILSSLHQQLPEIIETAMHPNQDDQ